MHHPGYALVPTLINEPDGKTPATSIRVCKEEAQVAAMGTIYAPGHPKNQTPGGRLEALPTDSGYATANKGAAVSCSTQIGGSASADCGCGVGLDRCLPGDSPGFDPAAFQFTSQEPLNLDQPTDQSNQAVSNWSHLWWGEEVSQLFGYILSQDRDFREILTGHEGMVNGPLVQFYQSLAPSTCCGQGVYFNQTAPEPLFDPAALPTDLLPHDTSVWKLVKDRGPHASGILTLPAFLIKFGSRRARAHVLYNAFKCEDFIAGNLQLKPSTEPNLMIRDGCSTCHATLEPLASYFSRILENDWTFLPPDKFPVLSTDCKLPAKGAIQGKCSNYYDPAFTDGSFGTLRGAYPDTFQNGKYDQMVSTHADEGPAGIAKLLTSDAGFAGCVAQNIAQAMLGRNLTPDDALLKQSLAQTFTQSGYKMSALVSAVVKSSNYRTSNNWTSTFSRTEAAK